MPDFLEREKARVQQQVKAFSSLIERIDKERHRMHHLDDFRELVEDLQEALEANLSERLRLITSGIPEKEQSQQLAEFRYRVKRLYDALYGFLVNSFDVPRELYFLSEIFLKYHKVSADYIISVSDEISLWPFTNLLQELGFKDIYPEFWKKMSQQEFFIVQVISEITKESMCLDWPLVLHEFAHITCLEKGTEETYFDTITVLEALRTIGALEDEVLLEEDPLVRLATKKLYTTEYLADLLVTRCFGAFYGWRFLKGWFYYSDFFEPDRYHPPSDKRIEKIAQRVKLDLGMTKGADFLLKELGAYGGQLPEKAEKEIHRLDINNILLEVDAALSKIALETKNDAHFILTQETIKQAIQSSPWSKITGAGTKITDDQFVAFLEKLHNAFLRGEPIIVEPPVTYFILTLDSFDSKSVSELDEPGAELIRRLVADSVRLYAIQERFSSDGL